jgi:hypothetical protein
MHKCPAACYHCCVDTRSLTALLGATQRQRNTQRLIASLISTTQQHSGDTPVVQPRTGTHKNLSQFSAWHMHPQKLAAAASASRQPASTANPVINQRVGRNSHLQLWRCHGHTHCHVACHCDKPLQSGLATHGPPSLKLHSHWRQLPCTTQLSSHASLPYLSKPASSSKPNCTAGCRRASAQV